MKLSNYKILLYAPIMGFLCICLISSCTQDLDGEISGFTPRIGVNSIINHDSIWKVKVFKTGLVFENQQSDFVDNASVIITDVKSNVQFQLEYTERGYYMDVLSRKPDFGRQYRIDVHLEGLKSVSAQAVVPSPVQVKVDETIGENSQINFQIEVHDNPAEENFYIIQFDVINRKEAPVDVDDLPVYELIDDGGVVGSDEKPKNLEIFVEESDFNSGDNIYAIEFNSDDLDSTTSEESEELKYVVKVHSVSKDLYLYLESRDAYFNDSADSSTDDPTPIHTNIEHGTGIFGAQNLQVF